MSAIPARVLLTHRYRLGPAQLAALEIYVTDPAHDGDGFPGRVVGGRLEVWDTEGAFALLTEAANSADADNDRTLCRALSSLASRVLRAA